MTTLTKSKPCSHVLSCLAGYVLQKRLCNKRIRRLQINNFRRFFFFLDRALCAIAFSVLDIGVIYLWPWV